MDSACPTVISFEKFQHLVPSLWRCKFTSSFVAQLHALIGEYFEDTDDICGAVISPRKGQVIHQFPVH